MSPEEVSQMEVAYASAKQDGLEGWDLVQVPPCVLFLVYTRFVNVYRLF